MNALIEGCTVPVYIAEILDGKRWLLLVGTIKSGVDWRINCKRLEALLLEGAVTEKGWNYRKRNSPFQLSVAADYIEEYPSSVEMVYHLGDKPPPPTPEFLALVLRSVVE